MKINVQPSHSEYQINKSKLGICKKDKIVAFSSLINNEKSEVIEKNKIDLSKQKEKYLGIYDYKMDVYDDNNFKNAPEFKAFIHKWMDKGASDLEAIERAVFYSQAGLLDYGDQTLLKIEGLEYSDKKQHGLHLINNHALKKAMLDTFDSLDGNSVGALVFHLFKHNGIIHPNDGKNYQDIAFQELIDEFSSKIEKLGGLYALDNKKYSNYKDMSFDGDINITNQMSQLEKNFIYDILIEYFKENISEVYQQEEITKDPLNDELLLDDRNALSLLISNFEKEVKKENENYKALNEYTRNKKAMPF